VTVYPISKSSKKPSHKPISRLTYNLLATKLKELELAINLSDLPPSLYSRILSQIQDLHLVIDNQTRSLPNSNKAWSNKNNGL
jgi:hypothetical protein